MNKLNSVCFICTEEINGKPKYMDDLEVHEECLDKAKLIDEKVTTDETWIKYNEEYA